MTMRRVLNVAWTLACDGLDEKGIEELHAWVYSNPAARREEERKRKARENQAAMTDLAGLFSMGG